MTGSSISSQPVAEQKCNNFYKVTATDENHTNKNRLLSIVWPCGGVVTQRIANPYSYLVFIENFLKQNASHGPDMGLFCNNTAAAKCFSGLGL